MELLLAISGNDASAWQQAFANALPEARISVWPETPEVVDFAAVWRPPAELFERVRVRHAIANLGAGVDALMQLPGLPASIPILRLEDAGMAEQMVEYVTLAVLAAFREAREYRELQREQRWVQRERLDKSTFVVGLLGLGVLGQAVARPLVDLGFPVHGWSRTSRSVPGVHTWGGAQELPSLLSLTRVLVCVLPSTPQTRGLIDRAKLLQLPRGAHVVNIGRGDVLVDDDLLEALDQGHLASATLDVFRHEPLPVTHRFWHHPRITVTPHVSAVTGIGPAVAQVAAKCRAILRGESIGGVIDRQRGY